MSKPLVRAVRCDHRSSDEAIYEALQRATAPLGTAWARLKAAKTISIKLNQAWSPDGLRYHAGHLQELVDHRVARAVLRLLREETSAEITCCEISVMGGRGRPHTVEETITLLPVLREFDVPFVDGDQPPVRSVAVPGGGLMFAEYVLPESVVAADAFVSVQKAKNHKFMGVTLCLKNLFGLCTEPPYGRPRHYYHHIIRLPYVLADLGRTIQPTLNIVDALVAQAGSEWGGEARVCDALIAGDQVTATDAVVTHLMGHDPLADWPTMPYGRDRNPGLVCHEHGFGTADLAEIDWASEVSAPLGRFYADQPDSGATVASWRKTMCEQALYYRDNVAKFRDYAGQFILLQDREVRWHGPDADWHRSRREIAGARPDSALWLKWVDPEEREGERYEVYEEALRRMDQAGL
ncbi:MAG: DUF362 domain-containing protein [Chloroflexi bacterium]|nr:DUF362 domain-containing protein [Chloroflexota bacterium]